MPVKIEVRSDAETERLAERASLVDELYELTQWLENSGANKKIKRAEEIKKALVEAANSEWNDRSADRNLDGTVAIATVSAASCKREITNIKGLYAWLRANLGAEQGDAAFWGAVTLPLSFVDKYLSEHEQAPFVTKTDGARKTTVRARNA